MYPTRCLRIPLLAILAALLWITTVGAQIEVWHIGQGGLDWASQAQSQIGALEIDGALQPLELQKGENLIQLLERRLPRSPSASPPPEVLASPPPEPLPGPPPPLPLLSQGGGMLHAITAFEDVMRELELRGPPRPHGQPRRPSGSAAGGRDVDVCCSS